MRRSGPRQTGEAVPERPVFDAKAALARIPLFRSLTPEGLDEVIHLMKERVMKAGDLIAEGGDQLLVIAEGRAEMLAPTLSGETIVVRSIGSGEVFGLNALLGASSGSVLRAVDTVRTLVLDGEVLAGLTRRHATIASARSGRSTIHAPSGGQRLTSATATVNGTSSGVLTGADVRAAARASLPAGRSTEFRL